MSECKDLEIIIFVDRQVEVECSCPVCLSVFESGDVLQFGCCGTHVCYQCNRGLKNAGDNCPLCRHSLRDNEFIASEDKYFEQNVLRGARVFCANQGRGCDWQGELRQLEDRVKKCPKSDKKCEFCGLVVPFDSMMHHPLACDGQTINCPNQCPNAKQSRKTSSLILKWSAHFEWCITLPIKGFQNFPLVTFEPFLL